MGKYDEALAKSLEKTFGPGRIGHDHQTSESMAKAFGEQAFGKGTVDRREEAILKSVDGQPSTLKSPEPANAPEDEPLLKMAETLERIAKGLPVNGDETAAQELDRLRRENRVLKSLIQHRRKK